MSVSFKFIERFQGAEKAIAHAARVTATKGAFMIFRAIFWIGLVSLLAPHEPDLGLGRPGAGMSLPARMQSWIDPGLRRAGNVCNGQDGACAGGADIKTASGRSLADIKNEIDANIRARESRAL